MMRSRHERRWAMFFCEIGLAWEYEPVTFRVAGQSYSLTLPCSAGRSLLRLKQQEPEISKIILSYATLPYC